MSEDTEIWLVAALLTAVPNDYSCDMVTAIANSTTEESAWIRKAQSADTSAFESLYRLHIGKVYGLCLRMTGNASEADDCAQETFIQAWRKLDKFRSDSAFSTWLHRIAVNTVLGRIRSSKREQERILVAAENGPAPVTTADGSELQDLSAAIDRLPVRARQVFILHAVYGYSHDETGEMLGVAAGTSKAQLHRAKNLLAQQLHAQGFEA
jgi:RNA polymerase sigma-70 factor (ECF subfamily)